ncbi:MAG: RHS repeat-associated core domain-containing protein [Paludibacteraceae bacterium]|nr:RHS repeat-associated core domain-containing protein [Paludibacteraceae bacterium]
MNQPVHNTTPLTHPFLWRFSSSAFTGKEKDPESGYHYFGARYYDSEALTGWLSVDPMMDKYPSLSPYNYCAWNPVRFVDPNGMEKIVSFINTPKNKRIVNAAAAFPDNDQVIHLWAHGLPNKINTYSKSGTLQEIKSWRDMQSFLSEESCLYRNRAEEEKMILVLHSCLTGQGENNIAKEISSGMELLVVAPTEKIQVQTHNEGMDNEYSEELGNMIVNKEGNRVEKPGTWNIFYKGILVDTLNHSYSPTFNDPQSTIETYEKIYQQQIYGE